jgi:sulfur carrier protein
MSPAATTSGLTIHVNDEPRAIAAASTAASLVADLGLAERKGVAVAINGSVVPRASWPTHTLVTGDRVLVIRATQGG